MAQYDKLEIRPLSPGNWEGHEVRPTREELDKGNYFDGIAQWPPKELASRKAYYGDAFVSQEDMERLIITTPDGKRMTMEERHEMDSVEFHEQKIMEAFEEASRHEQAIKKLQRFGEDNFEDGAVILFKKVYGSSGKVYQFAALKITKEDSWQARQGVNNEFWYLSGRSSQAMTWASLVNFMAQGGFEFWEATQWTEAFVE